MDLLKIILSNAKRIKNIEKHLCCLDPNGNGCPPISAAPGNTITCNSDGIFAAGGDGGAISIGDTVTSGTPGSVLFIGAGGTLAQDNPNLFYDDTQNALGVGKNTLDAKFSIHDVVSTNYLSISAPDTVIPDDPDLFPVTVQYYLKQIDGDWGGSAVTNQGLLLECTSVWNGTDPVPGLLRIGFPTQVITTPSDILTSLRVEGYVGLYAQGQDSAIQVESNSIGISIGVSSGVGISFNNTALAMTGSVDLGFSLTCASGGGVITGGIGKGLEVQSDSQIGLHARNSITSQPVLLVQRETNTGTTVDNIASFRGTTNFTVSTNSGLAIDIQPALPGAQISNATRLATRWTNIASPTSEIMLSAFNANAAVQVLTIQGIANGRVGIGSTVTAPTARLHLPAGTATAQTAPLKFTTGTAMTTAEDGALEYHTSHLYFTIGSTRFQLDQQLTTASATNGLTFLSGSVRLGQAPGASGTAMITGIREILTQNQSQGLRFQVAGNSSWRTDIRPNGINIVGATTNGAASTISMSYDDNPFTLDIRYDSTWDGARFMSNKAMSFGQGIQIEPNSDGGASAGAAGTYHIKFVSTTLMTTPENGAFEYDGTNLYFTTGGTRKTVTLV